MNDVLLSVIVPTKDRVKYLGPFLRAASCIDDPRVELVVADNSLDASVVREEVVASGLRNVKLVHTSAPLSQTGNSDQALSHATGEYVVYLGDDDAPTSGLIDLAHELSIRKIDAALFDSCKYYWPDVVFKRHRYPAFSRNRNRGARRRISPTGALHQVLASGATGLGDLPRVYHGMVARRCLESVRRETGSYFPGPSPDMANAAALSLVVKTFVYVPVVLMVDGIGYDSAGGRGVRGEHKARLRDVAQLPRDVENAWDSRIPRVWLGQTIWAQSCLMALVAMGSDAGRSLAWHRLYSSILVFHPDCSRLVFALLSRRPKLLLRCVSDVLRVFLHRAYSFLRSRVLHSRGKDSGGAQSCDSLVSATDLADSLGRADVAALGGWEGVFGGIDGGGR